VLVTTLALTLAPPRTRGSARFAFQVGCALVGSVLVALSAQFRLDIGIVPITGQTLGVLLVGAAYGPGLGAATLGLYLFWGLIGLPVFAPNADGSHMTGVSSLALSAPTAGYLWGFVLASGLVGWLARVGWDRTFRSSVSAMLLGNIAIYLVGLPWLKHALAPPLVPAAANWQTTLELGLYPFIIGDTLKLFLAASLLPGAWRLMARADPDRSFEE
jgi:biotin transport system substrate-specific component